MIKNYPLTNIISVKEFRYNVKFFCPNCDSAYIKGTLIYSQVAEPAGLFSMFWGRGVVWLL